MPESSNIKQLLIALTYLGSGACFCFVAQLSQYMIANKSLTLKCICNFLFAVLFSIVFILLSHFKLDGVFAFYALSSLLLGYLITRYPSQILIKKSLDRIIKMYKLKKTANTKNEVRAGKNAQNKASRRINLEYK
jgi:hypothetical protein